MRERYIRPFMTSSRDANSVSSADVTASATFYVKTHHTKERGAFWAMPFSYLYTTIRSPSAKRRMEENPVVSPSQATP
jgi:hypothetical protein